MNQPSEKIFVSLVFIIVSFLIYLSTMCPTLYLGDSGELTAAAFSLGIPHNSGYPLYAILGKLFCLIPIGNIGFRMNLMSACFAALTLWIVYALIIRITSSRISAFIGAFFLAFTPVFWFQTVSAEVYPLHIFLVAVLVRLLWRWDEKREFFILVLFVFITGISFGNHMQTVMLAPAVLWIIFSGDRRALLDLKRFALLTLFFLVALSVYLYLPIRTEAGAAIHWGDPDNLDRFLDHVTGRSHRATYVMGKTPWEYVVRTKEALLFVWSQFGVTLLFSVWGWLKVTSRRWRIFFGLVIICDFIYTVFLNTISLKVTAFTLPSCVILAILMGVGIAHILGTLKGSKTIGAGTHRFIKAALCIAPAIALFLNYAFCDQRRNYTGYEQATNTFRTVRTGGILILMGDNYFFPVVYGRLVERMREDVSLYDRLNLVFKYPNIEKLQFAGGMSWEDRRDEIEKGIIRENGEKEIYYGVYSPLSVKVPDSYSLVQNGILNRVVKRGLAGGKQEKEIWWKYYAKESFYEDFERDFMNREVCGHYFFHLGKSFFLAGRRAVGLKSMERASSIGFDNPGLHTSMAIFLTERGLFDEARKALDKALIYNGDRSYVYYIWGYYYTKKGKYDRAIDSLYKAIALKPSKYAYYNSLGYALCESGRKEEALLVFKKSLSMKDNQPEIEVLIKNMD